MQKLFSILLLTLFLNSLSFGQESSADPFISFPKPYNNGVVHYSFGASLSIYPRAIVEEEIRQIPMLNATIRFGLPSHFSLVAQFSTIYITNVVSAGAMWSYPIGDVSFSISDEFSYWFGFADLDGFDTQAMGLLNRPGISAGIDIDAYKITAKTEMLILISQHTYFGTASVGRVKPEIAGIVTSLTLEQDLWNSTFMSFAFRANYARPNYQVWLAFSVQDRWLVFPDLQVSFLF
ncbi:MAG: hypothetical protein WCW40_00130 [Bacteroidota bacterium]